jgi:serine/threonine-protein kinase
MATELYTHPTPEQLRAFAQGRLSSAEMAELEKHIAYCDSCCLQLAHIPDDTLVQLAREAATEGVKSPAAKPVDPTPKSSPGDIPKELREHPRYRVLSLVGHGGMGAVYKAEHRKMERLVALKVINQHLLANTQAVERFSREVRAVSKLSHPNIVLVHDADEAGSLHFLVMEFVDGVSLDRVIAHNGPLTPAQAANFIAQAARGLQHAHEKGMVHRDIKPQNLMMTRKKEIKILDFGLARLGGEQPADGAGQGSSAEKPGQTVAGMVLGTPDYIAPEQATDARSADIRADIYSLGCTMYYLLTAQPPFPTGSTIEKLNLHLKTAPPSILEKRPDVPAELARILDKMLAKNPSERYQTPEEAARDLASLEASGRRQPPGAAISSVAPAAAPVALPSSSPLDDAAIALAASPLRPVVQPKPAGQLPFGLTPPAAVALVACAVMLLALLAWGISSAISGSSQREPLAQQQPANSGSSDHVAPPTPLNSSIANPPSSNPGRPESPPRAAPATGAIASNLPRKVLLVVPSYDLYGPDYWGVVNGGREAGLQVEVASTTLDPIRILNQPGPGKFSADRLLSSVPGASEYGAVIFSGWSTAEFEPGGEGYREAQRLIQDFRENGRVIASICAGQRALDRHHLLEGKQVALCPAMQKNGEAIRGEWQPKSVVRAGQIITAGTADDGDDLMLEIAAHLAGMR